MTIPRSARYLAKVATAGPDECWPWTAYCNPAGYGKFVAEGEQLAHRYGYRLLIGELPPGMQVCHRCDNPPCQNPAHWFLGTHADNMADREAKGRGVRPPVMAGEGHALARLTEVDVATIRARVRAGETQTSVAFDYGVSQPHVSLIVSGRRWSVTT